MMSKEDFIERVMREIEKKKQQKKELARVMEGYRCDEINKNRNRALKYRRGRTCR